ncbi:11889_t:CDS:1 [Acaulospora morrowiae]|uniref:11889_t:CDS:1 n=1 Tax=Acaulospora morrowiae TaxID=94023 RepID=A0A9N9FPA3_9GLOM|nr:11889_t:CDS:1 [Acaulospora morrowiae]
MSEDFEDFVSTHEALKTIFPQASNEEITKYEKQLSSVKNLDPVLIISPNKAWINQQGWPAYYTVMDAFATNGLQNRRRDENSRVSFTSQPSPNSILYATIFIISFLMPFMILLPAKLNFLMHDYNRLE